MHRGDAVGAAAAGVPDAVQQAAQWLVLQHGGGLDAAQQRALLAWRQHHPEHERAWQAAQELRGLLGQLPREIGLEALTRAGRARRAGLRTVAGLAVSAPLAWWLWQTLGPAWTADLRTAVGERRMVVLADGSRLWLNTDTAVNLRFDAAARQLVLLAGEIYLEAAAAAASAVLPPLQVQTRAGRVRTTGARLLVRSLGQGRWRAAAYAQPARVEPARGGAAAVLALPAGMQTEFDERSAAPPRAADESAPAWREGVVVARGMRLAELAAEIGRYRSGVLHCDPAVAELRISGVFQVGDTERTLQALEESLPLRVHRRTRYWVTLAPRAG